MCVTFGDLKNTNVKKENKLDRATAMSEVKGHRRMNMDFKPVFNSNFLSNKK